jgi:predicted ATPase
MDRDLGEADISSRLNTITSGAMLPLFEDAFRLSRKEKLLSHENDALHDTMVWSSHLLRAWCDSANQKLVWGRVSTANLRERLRDFA